jgi:formylglycine-generating enzyme required for sulfatase activity
MRSIVVSLLTLLLLTGSHALAQVPGPIDPTGLKPRLLNIGGVRYELPLPPNADLLLPDRWSPGTFVILDLAKPKDTHSFSLRAEPTDPSWQWPPTKDLDRAVTFATGNTFRYRMIDRSGGGSGPMPELEGRVEIGDRAVGVSCYDKDKVRPVPEFCIAYLHHLKLADLQIPPVALCNGVEVYIGRHKQKRCLPVLPSPVQSFRDCPACPEMVVVPAGSFVMGSPADEPGRDQGENQVDVTIAKPFAVGRLAVTYADWEACLAAGGCAGHRPLQVLDAGWEWEQRGKRPVVGATWHAAKAYVAWLSKTTGKSYRLLSEAEREYATRAGTATPYWWGAAISTAEANYDGTRAYVDGTEPVTLNQTVPVDTFAPNPWGLYHVHGNVWEWTEDCANDSNIGNPGDGTARTTGDCKQRVIRGGAYGERPPDVRSASRRGLRADVRDADIGFRVARTLD